MRGDMCNYARQPVEITPGSQERKFARITKMNMHFVIPKACMI